jgi:hypothetical protein
MGLKDSGTKKTIIVGIVALVLVVVNTQYLNADKLTNKNPEASSYYNELMSLPDHSIVVTNPGAYSLGLFYAMSKGKDLIPIVYPYTDEWEFWDYYDWLKREYPTTYFSVNTLDTIKENLGNVYVTKGVNAENELYPYLILEEDFPKEGSIVDILIRNQYMDSQQIKKVVGVK